MRDLNTPELVDASEDLRAAIDRCGYYPDVVTDSLEVAIAGEPIRAYMLQHEPTFDRDEVRRHITILALTPSRLIVGHTDEHAADEVIRTPYASTSTEAIPLHRVNAVVVNRVVPNPAGYGAGKADPAIAGGGEVVLTIGWGMVNRIDLEPAVCADPNCEADHGYTGSVAADDISLRISSAADGPAGIQQVLEFAKALSFATSR
ncbi:DUF5998 family protein [Kribbella solani]|uniref:Phosphodiesterase n=1 Tax=Kribbella solani TaxID=236067 RepID=A0A841DK07_9ACTN|nr:DUF5998 family protein [Kribbella solani]MBB5978231.1 hypothetical protein [Kribbella solani]MDX2970106.1 DUF5998 family protein [Kribbella solani]MDX3005240.1 DUF5998 family protein [Kribbella solani]